jgi:hypothetical protein
MVAQIIPGADAAMDAASRASWEATVLVVIMLAGMSFVGYMLKQIMARHLATEERILREANERETRLAARVSQLEDMIRGELVQMIRANSEAMGRVLAASEAICNAANRMTQTLDRFTSVLDVRPCLLPVAEQRRLIKEVAEAEIQQARGDKKSHEVR